MITLLRHTPTSEHARGPRRRPILVVVGLLAALWAGCGECERDYDCPGGQVCNTGSGACEALVCGRDGDCAPGQLCRSNRCRAGREGDAGPSPDALVLTPAR